MRRKLATAQRFLVPSVARRERGDAPEGFGGGCAITTLRVSNNLDGAGRISRNQSDRCPLYGCVVLSWLREEIFCLCFNFPTDWTDSAKKSSVTSHVTDRDWVGGKDGLGTTTLWMRARLVSFCLWPVGRERSFSKLLITHRLNYWAHVKVPCGHCIGVKIQYLEWMIKGQFS